jgi:hypothetical protein
VKSARRPLEVGLPRELSWVDRDDFRTTAGVSLLIVLIRPVRCAGFDPAGAPWLPHAPTRASRPLRGNVDPATPPTAPIPALRSQADRASGRSPRVHGVTAPSRPSGGRTGTLSVRHELAAQTGGCGILGFWLPGPRPLPIEAV